ncbi:MAG: tetratricopeptide repeat protein, partial [Acidobacteriota bacterium]
MSGSLSGQSLYPPEKPEEVIAQLFASSHKAFAAGELEKAESDSRQVSGISLDQLGAIYLKLERYSLSEKAYREAAKVFALSPYPFIGLGVLSLNRGNYDEGMKWVNKILELNPLHPEARHVLGKLYFMKGEFSKASEELRDAYQLNPANTSVGYTLALAFLKQKKVEEAARVFQDMSGRLGESPQLHVLIGRAYRQTADSLDLSYAVYLEKAVAEFQEAVRLQPDFPRVHHYLGLTYLLQKGKQAFPLAMKEFVTELKREPDEYFANFYLGVLLATQRKHQKALPYLEKATRLDPQNP